MQARRRKKATGKVRFQINRPLDLPRPNRPAAARLLERQGRDLNRVRLKTGSRVTVKAGPKRGKMMKVKISPKIRIISRQETNKRARVKPRRLCPRPRAGFPCRPCPSTTLQYGHDCCSLDHDLESNLVIP